MGAALRNAWLGLMICALLFAVGSRQYQEMDIAVTYLMLFLTFPAGLLFAVLVAALSSFEHYLPGGLLGILVTWPFFLVFGYVQWFVLIPAIYRRYTKRQSDEPAKVEPHI